jgi:hypothetical protein
VEDVTSKGSPSIFSSFLRFAVVYLWRGVVVGDAPICELHGLAPYSKDIEPLH